MIDGRRPRDLRPEDFGEKLLRAAYRRRTFADLVRNDKLRQVTYADARIALDSKLEVLPGACVWANPSWPWSTEKPAQPKNNPYAFYTYEISGLISPDPIEPIEFWPPDMEVVGKDIGAWIYKSFRRGAGSFILSNQSTNSPSPEESFEWLQSKGFNLKEVIQQPSKGSNSSYFEDFWGVFTA